MPAIILRVAGWLGLPGMLFVGTLVFYEGLPLGPLRWIPYAGPVLESFADGRVDRERKAGALEERLLWEEQRRRMLVEQDRKRLAAQAEIDRIEREYLERSRQREQELGDLETTLRQMEQDNAARHQPSQPVLPRRLSESLDKIGRTQGDPG